MKQTYASGQDAAAKIPAAFEDYYRKTYPEIYAQRRAEVASSAQALLGVYQHNVFPEMKITWGTYPNNLGHTDFNGCFRCHDEQHASRRRENHYSGLQRLPQRGCVRREKP